MRTDTIEANHRAMQRIARALLRDPEAADDAVQDAWVAALGQRGEPLGRGWFRTVVRRLAWSRRGARVHDRLADDPIDDRGARSTSARATSARATALCAAIDSLPPQYREVLEHRYWADEPPRVIARRLGVDVRVVTNRLHRAHLQLRTRLERSEGRGSVHSMLVALAGPMRLRSGAVTAATAGGTKVAVAGAVAALLIVALAAVEVLRGVPDDERGPDRSSSGAGTRVGEAESASLSPLGDVKGDARRAGIASGTDEPSASRSEIADGGAGAATPEWIRLEIEVRDGTTGQDVEDFTFAFRAARQAAAHATDHVRLSGAQIREGLFTAGTYSMVVRARGYDDRDLGEVELTEGPVHDLGTVDLDRGSAVVEGRVVGPASSDLSRLVVSATGAGRWTCHGCDAEARGMQPEPPHRCGACGFDGVDTVVSPDRGTGRFVIDQLVGGPVRLVVSNATTGVLVASKVVAVPPASVLHVELSIDTKDVLIVLEGEDGRSFDGSWVEDAEIFRARILFHLWSGDIISARTDVAPGAVGLSLGDVTDGRAIVKSKRDLTGDIEAPDGGTALEELWPSALPIPPGLRPKPVDLERLEPGRYLLRGVPASVDSVQVACGMYVEAPVRFRDVPGVGEVAEIVVDDRCGVSARQVLTIEGVTCTSCHKAQGM